MILKCGCDNGLAAVKYQDANYGVGNRVHTPMTKEGMYRCTVCQRETGKSAEEKKSDKKLAKSKS